MSSTLQLPLPLNLEGWGFLFFANIGKIEACLLLRQLMLSCFQTDPIECTKCHKTMTLMLIRFNKGKETPAEHYARIMNLPPEWKAVRYVCYFEKLEIRQLIFQAIRIQEEILHSHDDKTFIISPGLLTAIYNDNLLKRVRDITQRIELLRLLFF